MRLSFEVFLIVLLSLIISCEEEYTLKYIHIMFRHGHRAP